MGGRHRRLPQRRGPGHHRGRLDPLDRLPLRPLWQTEVLPDDRALRSGRRRAGAGRRWRRTISTCWSSAGRPMSATSPARRSCGSPAPGRSARPACSCATTGAIHLLSTWDEGIPEDIPHENLYGIAWNPMNTDRGAAGHRRRGNRPARRNRRAVTGFRAAAADRVSRTPSWSTASWPCAPRAASRRPRRSPRCGTPSRWPSRRWPPRSPSCGRGSPNRRLAGVLLEAWRPAV